MCDWVATNYNRFGAVESGDIYGVIEGDTAFIIRSVFDRACSEAGINSTALLSHLKTKGLISNRGDGKGYTVGRRIIPGSKPIPCVAMKLNADEGEFDESYYNL